MLLTEDDVLMG